MTDIKEVQGQARIAELEAEKEQLSGMAQCMDIFRQDMIRFGIVGEACPPMFMTEGVCLFIAKIAKERDQLKQALAKKELSE